MRKLGRCVWLTVGFRFQTSCCWLPFWWLRTQCMLKYDKSNEYLHIGWARIFFTCRCELPAIVTPSSAFLAAMTIGTHQSELVTVSSWANIAAIVCKWGVTVLKFNRNESYGAFVINKTAKTSWWPRRMRLISGLITSRSSVEESLFKVLN